ncbi:hypothetical protein HDU67_002856 [Dinochytrium kinnereticum]|nr:hypothetical protein HDU67_002856 [Dinochytrium kinnereticum]
MKSPTLRSLLLLVLALLAVVAAVHGYKEYANGGAEAAEKKGCPLAGKCPYVKDHHKDVKEGEGEGCPLKKGGCPYYDQHKGDGSMADMLTAKGSKCPLSGKCPYYDDIKAGKEINLEGSNCPLAEKCPYYKEIKEKGGKITDCPLEKACPHFKKDFEKGGHAHHGVKGDSHNSEECPYLKREKAKAAAAAAEKEHTEL